jgi:hypothetical protein
MLEQDMNARVLSPRLYATEAQGADGDALGNVCVGDLATGSLCLVMQTIALDAALFYLNKASATQPDGISVIGVAGGGAGRWLRLAPPAPPPGP